MELNANNDDLENALSSDITISESLDQEEPVQPPQQPQMQRSPSAQQQPQAPQQPPQDPVSKEEEIGVHKGALNTLLAERNELIKMISNVEVIMQAHIARLKELGVEIKMKEPGQHQQ